MAALATLRAHLFKVFLYKAHQKVFTFVSYVFGLVIALTQPREVIELTQDANTNGVYVMIFSFYPVMLLISSNYSI